MNAPKMQVKCGVGECEYNKQHMCHASILEVNHNGIQHVTASSGTQCSTFKKGDDVSDMNYPQFDRG